MKDVLDVVLERLTKGQARSIYEELEPMDHSNVLDYWGLEEFIKQIKSRIARKSTGN